MSKQYLLIERDGERDAVSPLRITDFSAIVEVASSGSIATDYRRYKEVLAILGRASINGYRVAGVHSCNDSNEVLVPCFGHSYLCDKKGKHQGHMPAKGVARYFGIRLFVLGNPGRDTLQSYRIDHPESLITICVKQLDPTFNPAERAIELLPVITRSESEVK